MSGQSLICLIDGTRFYANSSGILQPELRDKPVAVVSGKQGIIIAANKACDAVGLKKFKPIFEYKDKLEAHDVAVVEANFNWFGHVSRAFQNIIITELPEAFSYSVDEVIGRTPPINDQRGYLQQIRRKVYKQTRVPTGASASLNVTLAKVASFAAKKLPGYNGVAVLTDEAEINSILAKMDVSDIWGIGRRLSKHMYNMQIRTALDLKNADIKKMKPFGKPVVSTIFELRGQQVFSWRDPSLAHTKDTISSSRSIRERVQNKEALHQALAYHVHLVCAKVRDQNSTIKVIQFYCSTSRYDTKVHHGQVTIRLDYPTNNTSTVLKLLSQHIDTQLMPQTDPYIPIYKVGVIAHELCDERTTVDMFAPPENRVMMQTLDAINEQFGVGSLFLGTKGTSNTGERQESEQLRNPHANWQDIPSIEC
jgi:DNA polymerase V